MKNFVLNNETLRVEVSAIGASLTSIYLLDKHGEEINVLLTKPENEECCPYLGTTIGRYAGRISFGKFELEGEIHQLDKNWRQHHLHGGKRGLHQVEWKVLEQRDQQITFGYFSHHKQNGYPGNVSFRVTYLLEEDGLSIIYKATPDRPTHINMTNHSYFNLNGTGDILEHELRIPATHVLELGNDLLPTGNKIEVRDSVFDFSSPKNVGENISDSQLDMTDGFDHTYILKENNSDELIFAAELFAKTSGISLEIWTTEPGLQLYTGNHLNGGLDRPEDCKIFKYAALCLETQHFPDSPNRPDFPSTVYSYSSPFRSKTTFVFNMVD